jgi:hypothetical protein
MISERFVIGVDDTDAPGGPGTSKLVRRLGAKVEADGFGTSLGVTRHQLSDSEKLRRTDRNHCYALVLDTGQDVLDVEDFVVDFVRAEAAPDANPAIALLSRHSDMPHALAFGRRAQLEVLKLEEAERYAAEANVLLRGLGGTRMGMIGALSAAGLRAGGKDGRYTDLRGLRDLAGRVTAGQIRATTDLQHILNEDGEELDRDDPIDTFDWIRPRLEEGEPVLRVHRSPENRHLYLPVDRRERPASAG